MDESRTGRALARAEARIVDAEDMFDALAYLISSCQDVLDVDAIGVMLTSRSGRLQLLAASNHQSVELELYQSQIDEGPCVDAASSGEVVTFSDEHQIRRRWPRFGASMVQSGFLAVHSAPLRTASSPIGAMALFRRHAVPFDEGEDEAAQAYADLVTSLVLPGRDVEPADVHAVVETALSMRVDIERAKGVMAQTHGVDMGAAYDMIRAEAAERGESLTVTAAQIVKTALHTTPTHEEH